MGVNYVYRGKKLRFYIGTGVRTDIRLDGPMPYVTPEPVADNSRSISASVETLLGIEVPVSSKIMLNLEPTFSSALVPYTREIGLNLAFPSTAMGYPYALMDQYPGRFWYLCRSHISVLIKATGRYTAMINKARKSHHRSSFSKHLSLS